MSKKSKSTKSVRSKSVRTNSDSVKTPASTAAQAKRFKEARVPARDSGLGNAMSGEKLYGEVAIEENQLERFPNRTLVRRYTIDFTCPEFTCLCPRSGFPDFATIKIRVVPDQWCVELKSLKLYINGFRNKKVFHEDVTNVILQDLVDLLDPHEITVVGDFTVRGNIHTVVTAEHKKASR
ncbi:MAG TPA: preQ(1) synthase [Pseudobdellovibrionaceae bacterium]|nr:preQ(1) synthase [Pseudobdellovibrionaceae bacterium]